MELILLLLAIISFYFFYYYFMKLILVLGTLDFKSEDVQKLLVKYKIKK